MAKVLFRCLFFIKKNIIFCTYLLKNRSHLYFYKKMVDKYLVMCIMFSTKDIGVLSIILFYTIDFPNKNEKFDTAASRLVFV